MNEFGAYSVNGGHMVKVAVKAKGDADYDDELPQVMRVEAERFSPEQLIDIRSQMDYIKPEDSDAILHTSFTA